MGPVRTALRGACFYWRTSLALMAIVAFGCGILVASLTVGHSVRQTLYLRARQQLGQVRWASLSGDRFIHQDLASRISDATAMPTAGIIRMTGHISSPDGQQRVNGIDVLGVDEGFFALAPGPAKGPALSQGGIWVNLELADRMGLAVGQTVLLQVPKPTTILAETHIVSRRDRIAAIRGQVRGILSPEAFGRFSLDWRPRLYNAFVYLPWLQAQIGLQSRVNCLLVAAQTDQAGLYEAIKGHWRLADLGLALREVPSQGIIELRTDRVFLDSSVAQVALDIGTGASGVLTYLASAIRMGSRSCPYPFVAALGSDGPYAGLLKAATDDRSIVLNQWLAQDIGAEVGDQVEVEYLIPQAGGGLAARTQRFRVAQIVPISGLAADPTLAPRIPGISDTDNCSQWDPGLPIDLDAIRPKDEQYWDQYRGTPKAFIPLDTGVRLWAGRYGQLTAVRWPSGHNHLADLNDQLLARLDPSSLGLAFRPAGRQMIRAVSQATDLGMLLLGMSGVLIAAGLVLVGLVFGLLVESRGQQLGLMSALGLGGRTIRLILVIEGGMAGLAGGLAGIPVGLGMAWALVKAISGIWPSAVAGMAIGLHLSAGAAIQGSAWGILAALVVIWSTCGRWLRARPIELLSGTRLCVPTGTIRGGRSAGWAGLAVCLAIASAIALWSSRAGAKYPAAGFFTGGAMLLCGSVLATRAILARAAYAMDNVGLNRTVLVLRSMATRPGRALAVVAMLACGVFLVVAVGANRDTSRVDPADPKSGTGGFGFYGQFAIPIPYDLTDRTDRAEVGLDDPLLQETTLVQVRVARGDEASCLNLARAQRPALLGVEPNELAGRFAFRTKNPRGWQILEEHISQDVVPAVGDYPTVVWALGKGLGDRIEYVDQTGRSFSVRIVGIISDSILQGGLVIGQKHFLERFPAKAGFDLLLVATRPELADRVQRLLSGRLVDYGLELTDSASRLAAFHQVEATYLSIFASFGHMGLIVGTVGLALVVLRNLLERRGELALMMAMGFEKSDLIRLVRLEHTALLCAGLIAGAGSALLAIWPAMSHSSTLPFLGLVVILASILLCGWICVGLAARAAMMGGIWDALRNE